MAQTSNTCDILQHSLKICEGTPELPGMRRTVYFTSFGNLAKYPTLPKDSQDRITDSVLTGEFVMKENAVFQVLQFDPGKSTFTSDAQGEWPNQTQLDKLTLVCPDVGPRAGLIQASINNTHNVFLFQDKKGRWRMVGTPDFDDMKNSCAQDIGQGSAGSTSTTISVEATNHISGPYFNGTIPTADGEVDLSSDLL